MIQKAKRFFALSPEEKKLFLEAYLMLGFMRAAIPTISFKRLTRTLQHSQNYIHPATLTSEQLHTAKLVGKMITQAANNTPWNSACLAQALTAQRILIKRDIPGVFYLGAKKNKGAKEKMAAHAWSQCGETIITGEKGHEAFTILSLFEWGQK
jgi:hypothetical protein